MASEAELPPINHTDSEGRDRDWRTRGWTPGRCAGEFTQGHWPWCCRELLELQLQVPAGEQQLQCIDQLFCEPPPTCRHLPAVLPRHAGYCDDVYGMCWCDASSKYGWKGMANGTARPSARPLGDSCHPSTDKAGVALDWGSKRYDELYGTTGWCDADKPTWHGR
jgi:hypothetical protein